MKATEARLLEFLKKSPQFVIPIYQRTYSWGKAECRQLWDDILRTGRNDKISAHFVGSIVYVEKGLYSVTGQSPLLVIDGQQRLTTLMLLIEALTRSLNDREPMDGFSAKKLRNYYLLNPMEDGERRYKLVLSQIDKASLIAILDQQPRPKDHSIRVDENFSFFKDQVAEIKDELPALCKGLAKLLIVDISLSRGQDDPQLIFESLNSTGRELSQADLIRNFILMGLEPQLQTRLYELYWRPMEVDFGQEGYAAHFDSFIRHYLTMKTGEIPNIREVYEAFKQYARSPGGPGVEILVSDIRAFARYYCAMALGAESDTALTAVFHDLRELKVDVAYPFLLELYHDYAKQVLHQDDLLRAVRLVESYVFRRAVCAIPTNSLNKTFATFARVLKKDRYLESIQAHFLLLPSYRRFPSDEEFKRDLQTKDLYNFRSRSYWLRRLENHDRKERVPVDEYTIEHILPQNENLSTAWKQDLGPEWKRIQQTWLHTLGNLTLTGYNSEYSDRPFSEKRDMKGGFRKSPLRLNEGLSTLGYWNEDSIRARAEQIALQAVGVWSAPSLDRAVLDAYRPEAPVAGYTIDDHLHLVAGPLRELFEAFRKQVLALDPCVTEEFLKLYVAYKAETNFVDIVPQAKRLRLSLNMEFPEINDPKGICKDVSNLGRWGNGDVEVGLAAFDDLPYVLGLVRQALEKQLGNGDGA
ncbi:MAG: GmrSD restriction endonuclease domain-containing protein [Acidiferrobacteraceae bacterium]